MLKNLIILCLISNIYSCQSTSKKAAEVKVLAEKNENKIEKANPIDIVDKRNKCVALEKIEILDSWCDGTDVPIQGSCELGEIRCLPRACEEASLVEDPKNHCKKERNFEQGDCGVGFGRCLHTACAEKTEYLYTCSEGSIFGETECIKGFAHCLPKGCVDNNSVKDKNIFCKLREHFDQSDCGVGYGRCVSEECVEAGIDEVERSYQCEPNQDFVESGCGEGYGRCLLKKK